MSSQLLMQWRIHAHTAMHSSRAQPASPSTSVFITTRVQRVTNSSITPIRCVTTSTRVTDTAGRNFVNVRIGSCPRIRANATGDRTAIQVVTFGSTSRQPDTEHSNSQFLVKASRRHRRVARAGTRMETVASSVVCGSATTVVWSPTERYTELTTSDRRRYS